jgi:hypothetical protein
MMKRLGVLVMALVLTACDSDNDGPTGTTTVGPIVFAAQLLASNEVPPVSNAESGARGSVTITMSVPRDTAGNPVGAGTVTFSMQAQALTPGTPVIAAHIHPGAAGMNGPPLLDTGLAPTAPMVLADGTGNLIVSNLPVSQQVAAQITANPAGFYFNMHTPLNPGGVIRGQLSRLQ